MRKFVFSRFHFQRRLRCAAALPPTVSSSRHPSTSYCLFKSWRRLVSSDEYWSIYLPLDIQFSIWPRCGGYGWRLNGHAHLHQCRFFPPFFLSRDDVAQVIRVATMGCMSGLRAMVTTCKMREPWHPPDAPSEPKIVVYDFSDPHSLHFLGVSLS